MSDRIGGHIVQGHIDGVGKILSRSVKEGGVAFKIGVPKEIEKYIVQNGSIAVDGVSLTIGEIRRATGDGRRETEIEVSLIPYTMKNTTLGELKQGNLANLEVDIIGKYLKSTPTADAKR